MDYCVLRFDMKPADAAFSVPGVIESLPPESDMRFKAYGKIYARISHRSVELNL